EDMWVKKGGVISKRVRTPGRVTEVKRCQELAPSSAAASCRSSGTACRPARIETAKKGMPRQMLARQSEARAFQASPRKLMLCLTTPQFLRIQELGLRTPSKSISQARLLMAVGTIHGNSKPARRKRL